jgi:hypothetical protein
LQAKGAISTAGPGPGSGLKKWRDGRDSNRFAASAEHDPRLWNRVVVHRDNLRHKIAHADLEPSASETKAVVDDFLAMANAAQTIT